MILVNVEAASSILNLDDKTKKVLKMLSKGNENVRLGEFIQTLVIMDFDNWDYFDVTIEQYTTKVQSDTSATYAYGMNVGAYHPRNIEVNESQSISFLGNSTINKEPIPATPIDDNNGVTNTPVVETGEDSVKKTPVRKKKATKEVKSISDVDKRVKKYIKEHNHLYSVADMARDLGIGYTVARNRVLKYDPNHKTTVSNTSNSKRYNDNFNRIKEYIDTHDVYYVMDMSEELGIGETAIRRYVEKIDPEHKKLGARRNKRSDRKSKVVESIFNYITLSTGDEYRKSWVDGAVNYYAKEKHIAKATVMTPIYKDLKEKYGIVFSQKGRDYLYEHKFVPVEDYPAPTAYDILVLDEEVFNIAQGLIIDRYGVPEIYMSVNQ